jgi:GTP-binding protein
LEHIPLLSYKEDQNQVEESNGSELPTIVQEQMDILYTSLSSFTATQLNVIIRALGKRRRISSIFMFLDRMREYKKSSPNDESLEFLANSCVASVEEEKRAKSMKDLPSASMSIPEVLLIGRSNVGKSTLVNFLVNRKALASVSATPGHTTQFHFYSVNKGRKDLPSFCFVDVPGLGYAEAEDNTVTSWKSLLERYMTVRDSLGVVLHLVDSRHQLTETDHLLFKMVDIANKNRLNENKTAFQYAIVLTKSDRAQEHILKKSLDAAEIEIKENNGQVIITSSIDRIGRDAVWKMLQKVLG